MVTPNAGMVSTATVTGMVRLAASVAAVLRSESATVQVRMTVGVTRVGVPLRVRVRAV